MPEFQETIDADIEQKLTSAITAWQASWVNPGNGPSPGGRRDQNDIAITDAEVLRLEREAYEVVVHSIVEILRAAQKEGVAPYALRKTNAAVGLHLAGTGLSRIRAELTEHVLLDILLSPQSNDVEERIEKIGGETSAKLKPQD